MIFRNSEPILMGEFGVAGRQSVATLHTQSMGLCVSTTP